MPLVVRVAREAWEFEAIHRLNYATFVEEIPQHAANDDRRLVDRFHDENTYLVALRDRRLVGMIALRETRPFSLDGKLPDLDRYLPQGSAPCEIRLLAVEPEARQGAERQGFVFLALARALARHALASGFDVAVISGTTRQLELYRHVGFEPFGPLVGTPGAFYQPMRLTLERFRERGRAITVERKPTLAPGQTDEWTKNAPAARAKVANFLPGPVDLDDEVVRALAEPSISHRDPAFRVVFDRVRDRLRAMTSAEDVHLAMGGGTLANEIVAAELARRTAPGARGLVLANGVFGERLVDHARRAGLAADVVRAPWGEPFDVERIAHRLEAAATAGPGCAWLWCVHGETSTGVLNDLDTLRPIAARANVPLAIDATSSLGAVPCSMDGIALAASASGKGLASIAGLAIVLRSEEWLRRPKIGPRPVRLFDLDHAADAHGLPHTIASHLVLALDAALWVRRDQERVWAAIARASEEVRSRLASLDWSRTRGADDGEGDDGVSMLATDSIFPAIVTLVPHGGRSAGALGAQLERAGILVAHRSRDLVERNWMQIALYGIPSGETIDRLVAALEDALSGVRAPA